MVRLVGGTVFSTLQEGWAWLDALYSCVTTLATVGLGDLAPATDVGTVFTIVFIVTGVGLIGAFLAVLTGHLRSARQPDRG